MIEAAPAAKAIVYRLAQRSGVAGDVPVSATLRARHGRIEHQPTQAEAEAYLYKNLQHFCDMVNGMIKFEPTQGETDALTSFAYNVGAQNLKTSTLLRKANEGDVIGASEEFGKWIHANGKVMQGLVRRREAEREMFLS